MLNKSIHIIESDQNWLKTCFDLTNLQIHIYPFYLGYWIRGKKEYDINFKLKSENFKASRKSLVG